MTLGADFMFSAIQVATTWAKAAVNACDKSHDTSNGLFLLCRIRAIACPLNDHLVILYFDSGQQNRRCDKSTQIF